MDEFQQLPGVGSLLQEAWQRIRNNFGTLLKLEAIAGVVMLVAVVIAFLLGLYSAKESIPFSASTALAVGVAAICAMLARLVVSTGQVRLLASEEAMSVLQVVRHAWRRFDAVIGNSLLLFLVFAPLLLMMMLPFVAGGAIFYFRITESSSDIVDTLNTIALVGGISFIVAMPLYFFLFVKLSFVMPLVAIGETTSAWKESWNLANGRYWAIFWRMFAGSLVISLIGSMLQGIIEQLFSLSGSSAGAQVFLGIIGGTLSILFQLVFVLFGVAYGVSLLRCLQKVTHEPALTPPS